jgi:hypothetical protein
VAIDATIWRSSARAYRYSHASGDWIIVHRLVAFVGGGSFSVGQSALC